MTHKPIAVVEPRIDGLDEYMAKVERLSSLLSEAINLHDELKNETFEVGYEVSMPTLNSCPQPGHSPSPDEIGTFAPHDGH